MRSTPNTLNPTVSEQVTKKVPMSFSTGVDLPPLGYAWGVDAVAKLNDMLLYSQRDYTDIAASLRQRGSAVQALLLECGGVPRRLAHTVGYLLLAPGLEAVTREEATEYVKEEIQH